ncbi:MAG: DNA polymerase [Candidatus Altiarchaeota archaeon]|nr:DNA polymerase [Candidatus Altiarchaeota archaeon]
MFILLDIDYAGTNKAVIRLFGRNEVKLDTNFSPYFYIVPDNPDFVSKIKKEKINERTAERIELVKRKFEGKEIEVVQLFLSHPKDVPAWRYELKKYGKRLEADIPFARRYMIDKSLSPLGEVKLPEFEAGKASIRDPRVLAFDIETISDGPIKIGKNKITMISLWGQDIQKVITWAPVKGEHVELVKGEKELIQAFIRTLSEYKPEIVVGYNSDMFDWPYIKKRAEKYKLNLSFNKEKLVFVKRGRASAPRISGMNLIDLYVFVRDILSPYMSSETLGLGAVAQELLNETKLDIGGHQGMTKAWEENPEVLYEYALQDAKITYGLAKEILPLVYELGTIVGLPLFDMSRMRSGQLVEWLLIKEAHSQNTIAPNRPKRDTILERRQTSFEGAFVKEPIKGLHKQIAVCDFRSLYPTIIMSQNISPDTIDCEHADCKIPGPTGHWFCKNKAGFTPKILKSLFDERLKLKSGMKKMTRDSVEYKIADTKQKALKLILNSVYGYLGFPGARWYSLESARAVTAIGREYIKQIMETAEKLGFTVVYGDTDSVMLTLDGPNFEKTLDKFLKKVNKTLPAPMELELDGVYDCGLFVTKKRYALMDAQGKMVIKGLERVRRDWAQVARKTQEQVLRLILQGDTDGAIKHVKSVVAQLKKKEIPIDQVIITEQMTKRPEEYKAIGPHVKVARDLIKMGKPIEPGSLIEYVVQIGKGSISSRSIPAETAQDYDSEYYIERQVIPAVARLFEAMNRDQHELQGKQSRLEFFS